MITHHCRECGETVPAGGCVAHPAAFVDSIDDMIAPVFVLNETTCFRPGTMASTHNVPHASLIMAAQALVGTEPGDRWYRVAARVVYYDPHARPRDLADAIVELRVARDAGRP